MTRTLRHLLILFVLLPQLAVASLGKGLVLCIAPGGHLEVELVASSCCSEAPVASRPSGEARFERERPAPPPACPSCEDVDLLVDPNRPDRESFQPPTAPPGSVAVVVGERSRAWSRHGRTSGRTRPGAHLASLRTVVLRC